MHRYSSDIDELANALLKMKLVLASRVPWLSVIANLGLLGQSERHLVADSCDSVDDETGVLRHH